MSELDQYKRISKKDFLYRHPKVTEHFKTNRLAKHLSAVNKNYGIDYYFKSKYNDSNYGFVFNTGTVICPKTKLNFGNFKIHFDFDKAENSYKSMFVTGGNFYLQYTQGCYAAHYNIYKVGGRKKPTLKLCNGHTVAEYVRRQFRNADIILCVRLICNMLHRATIDDGLGYIFKEYELVKSCEVCDDVIFSKEKICKVCKELV